ncbi:hypothetical protein L7F22_052390 [Adiantum nelumboides]|nr:hypothetical protein [Adiantum nelumboides]
MGHPPQRYEPFYSGQPLSHETFNPQSAAPFRRGPHLLPDLQGGRPSEFNPHQSYLPHGHPPHFGEDRRDRVSHGPVQAGVSQFPFIDKRSLSSNGSMYADPRLGDRNDWIESERDFAYQQQRRYADMGERIEFGERFQPTLHAAELPRVDSNIDIPENRFKRGFRGEHNAAFDDSRLGRGRTKHHHDVESFNSVGHGRSEYEPLNDALGDAMHGNTLPSHLNVTQGGYHHCRDPVFVLNGRQASMPESYNALGSTGLQTREEEALKYQKWFAQQGLKREDNFVQQHDCQAETYGLREEMRVDDDMNRAPLKRERGVKRKHGQQCLSREEELLIEKGLLDDDSSERQLHESVACRVQEGNEHFMSSHKQGHPEENESYYQQLGYQSSLPYSESQTLHSTELGEPGGHKYENVHYVRSEGQRNKRQEVDIVRAVPKLLEDWQHENLTAKGVSFDDSLDKKNPSHFVGQHPHFDGVQTNKDFIYRQYLEWEAEEKHMEALRRAERLAREIQQREESKGTYEAISGQAEPLRKQEAVQDNRLQAYHQREEKVSVESVEASSELNKIQRVSQLHEESLQHHTHQNPKTYSCRVSHFQEAHRPNQQLPRDSFGHDVQPVDSHGGLQPHQQDSLVQLPAMSLQTQWLKEQTPTQSHLGHHRNSQAFDQQSMSLRSVHSLYPWSATEELSQERSDRGSSLSSYSQLGSHTAHELAGSFPPLPSGAFVNPPPPDSPPPPLPPSHPPASEAPPPPLTVTTFPSAKRNTLQGSVENPHQSLPPDSQGADNSHAVHMGIPQAHNLSQFQPQPLQPLEKSKIVDAGSLFRNPGRLTRPDRFVVILRGLPGSGKSYIAKVLRDVEVMNGGSAPRIHSMDDYFTCEVEREEEVESGSSRSKKKVVKRAMEYCYEPEMEEVYRASMLKAFRKTLEEGMFKFVIVDDRNVLIADFAQFWAIAKRSGYEAYILEAPYSDVKGCAARNVHNFTEQHIQSLAERWESTPSLYFKMDVSSLFRADDLNDQDIIEVDMDADDMERDLEEEEQENNQSAQDHLLHMDSERPVSGDRWEDKGDAIKKTASLAKCRSPTKVGSGSGTRRKSTDNALSGLMTTYGKKDKFVHWSDNQGIKGSSTGFSIGSATQMAASLVIGPGPGYNGMSNLLVMGDNSIRENPEMRKSNKFVEQLRAEQEAFKAVFARRRQRIGGMYEEEDD